MKIKKLLRSIRLYGVAWSLIKIAGRTRSTRLRFLFPRLYFKKGKRNLSLIGCGQFGFSSISFHLFRGFKNYFLQCFDTDEHRMQSTSSFWGYKAVDVNELLANDKCEYVYIASNHFSHAEYAIESLNNGKNTYIEKPISVCRGQLDALCNAIERSSANVYVGYNRPFSKAISMVVPLVRGTGNAISLSCHVTGHFLDADHWYRDKKEGTRVCGNMGHWIDLSIYLMAQRGKIPGKFHISIAYASRLNTDDNFVVSYSTDLNDIITICMTSRSEPFEGINETINLNSGPTIAKIDDFRQLQVWEGSKHTRKKFLRKDIGHRKCILQPFEKEIKREFSEVIISTLLMLKIKEMVEAGDNYSEFDLQSDSIYTQYVA